MRLMVEQSGCVRLPGQHSCIATVRRITTPEAEAWRTDEGDKWYIRAAERDEEGEPVITYTAPTREDAIERFATHWEMRVRE